MRVQIKIRNKILMMEISVPNDSVIRDSAIKRIEIIYVKRCFFRIECIFLRSRDLKSILCEKLPNEVVFPC